MDLVLHLMSTQVSQNVEKVKMEMESKTSWQAVRAGAGEMLLLQLVNLLGFTRF